ncbi:MAG: hypothetical protein K2H72_00660, partial [Muribaculaceae bacterium]|nr:hypothetical protein [Muribaculaceae bacterium]
IRNRPQEEEMREHLLFFVAFFCPSCKKFPVFLNNKPKIQKNVVSLQGYQYLRIILWLDQLKKPRY